MTVACFCGAMFEIDGKTATCPTCGAVAIIPAVNPIDIDAMMVELQTILDDHGTLPD